MKKANTLLLLGALAGVGGAVLLAKRQNEHIVTTTYRLESAGITKPVKIVQLSDLHSAILPTLEEKTRALSPDLIAVTGDYINDRGKNKTNMLQFARTLCSIAPVTYIPGNHERRLPYFEALMQQLETAGFHVLVNREERFQLGGSTISVLGLSEKQADKKDYVKRAMGNFQYDDLTPLLKDFETREGFKLVLCHFPENFEKIEALRYSRFDFDLMLSGHAHGGQFDLPGIGPCFSPGQGLFPQYAKGIFGTHPQMIVSRGLGNSEFPLRLFNYPEIVNIEIQPKQQRK